MSRRLTASTPRRNSSSVTTPSSGSVPSSPKMTGVGCVEPFNRTVTQETPYSTVRPSAKTKSHSCSAVWPNRSRMSLGIHVYVAPVSTKASRASNRSPLASPTSIRTRNAPIICSLDPQGALVLAPDAPKDPADLAQRHVVLDALDKDRHQVLGALRRLVEPVEQLLHPPAVAPAAPGGPGGAA